jgi:putative transposase
MLQGLLVQERFKLGRLHLATLMKRMDRGTLSQTEDLKTGARTQDIRLSAAKAARDATQSGLGRGHYLYPHGFIYLAAVMDWFRHWHQLPRSTVSLLPQLTAGFAL